MPDLMVEAGNGIGGRTKAEYTPDHVPASIGARGDERRGGQAGRACADGGGRAGRRIDHEAPLLGGPVRPEGADVAGLRLDEDDAAVPRGGDGVPVRGDDALPGAGVGGQAARHDTIRRRRQPAHRTELRVPEPNGSTQNVGPRPGQRSGVRVWAGEAADGHGLRLRRVGKPDAGADGGGRHGIRRRARHGARLPTEPYKLHREPDRPRWSNVCPMPETHSLG